MTGKMVGKKYRHSKLGVVEVIRQPGYRCGSPRNVLVRLIQPPGFRGHSREVIVPQRSLRRLKGGFYEAPSE